MKTKKQLPLQIALLRLHDAEANIKFFNNEGEHLLTLNVCETYMIKPSLMGELVEVVYKTQQEVHIHFLNM